MSANPLNQLPVDAELVRRVDAAARALAAETGHLTLVLAIKENGKAIFCLEGIPADGPFAELARDPPHLVELVAMAMRLSEALDAGAPRS